MGHRISSKGARARIAAAVVAAALGASAALGGVAFARSGAGAGQHQVGNGTKVRLCHKGKVAIRVGAPAVRAHRAHGDTLGPCPGTAAAQAHGAANKAAAASKASSAQAKGKAKGNGTGKG